MGTASLVIGIVCVVLSLCPVIGLLALLPAVLGFVLGIVDVVFKVRKNVSKGHGIAGIVLNSTALLFIVIWSILVMIGFALSDDDFAEIREQVRSGIIERVKCEKPEEKAVCPEPEYEKEPKHLMDSL
jgi:Na+/melibiose symporter-like transporter